MSRHVLVTNDFPPKIGGIQNYLWELWRRLPPDSFAVYTTPYAGAATFDAKQPYPVERSPEPVIGPYPWLIPRLNRYAEQVNADFFIIDPALPLGAIGPNLNRPYGVVLHGAEVTIPGRLPASRALLARTLRSSSLAISAGAYALEEAERCAGRKLTSVVVPPGVDSKRFTPLTPAERHRVRAGLGLSDDVFVVATVNRLVPRKGMDVLIRAAAELSSRLRSRGRHGEGPTEVQVLIGGRGRHRPELERLIADTGAPVRLLGRVSDAEVVNLYGAADAMAMLCHDRWFGLEQEGFGIVFLEAAAAGIPQIAGRSGGAHEAVVDGETGLIMDDPLDHRAVADALESLAFDPQRARALGAAARTRAVAEFDYELLAERLGTALATVVSGRP